MMRVTCEHCGSKLATATDKPDCTKIECPVCMTVDFSPREDEEEFDEDGWAMDRLGRWYERD